MDDSHPSSDRPQWLPVAVMLDFGMQPARRQFAFAVRRFDVTAILRHSHGPITLRVEPYSLSVTRDRGPVRGRTDTFTTGKLRFVVPD